MKKIAFLLLFICTHFSLSAVTITWTGYVGDENWANPDNWDLRILPTANDLVIIPNGAGMVIIDDFAQVNQLDIGEKVKVHVSSSGHLQSLFALGIAILIQPKSSLLVDGDVSVLSASGTGIFSDGLIPNKGEIVIESPSSRGMEINGIGKLQNEKMGLIRVESSISFGLLSRGKIDNLGQLDLHSKANRPLSFSGVFNNWSGGEIILQSSDSGALLEGAFYNEGEIVAYGIASNVGINVLNGGRFENNKRGVITIHLQNHTRAVGMAVSFGGILHNDGDLVVNGGGVGTGQGGIVTNLNGVFGNTYNGKIVLDDLNTAVVVNSTARSWENYGDLRIYNASSAMQVNANVYNGGNIDVEGRINVELSASWYNDKGELSIDAGTAIGLSIFGALENDNCGLVRIDGELQVSASGKLNNFGFLELGEGGSPASILGSLYNYGVIHDPGEKLANNFTNHNLRIIPLDDTFSPCFVYENVFDLGNNVSTALPTEFYADPDLTIPPAAIYWESDNEATIINLLPVYYARFVDNNRGCSRVFSIPRAPCPSPLHSKPHSELNLANIHTNAKTKPSISPNPTNGHLQIQTPTILSGEVTFQLVDLLGRVMWESEIESANNNGIELPSSLSDAWYIATLYQGGKLIHQEKIYVQRSAFTH